MTLVVSNTSPLTNLAAIGHFDLLRELFGWVGILSLESWIIQPARLRLSGPVPLSCLSIA